MNKLTTREQYDEVKIRVEQLIAETPSLKDGHRCKSYS